jgi:DNA-binding transcriptional LysR family regulator
VKLLERTTRHVALTEAGKIFLIEARSLVSQLASAVRNTRAAGMGTAGRLTLAYMDFAVHRLLPDLLSAVSKGSPDIHFDLTYMSSAQQKLALMDGAIDLGIMIGGMSNPFVESVRLADEPLVVAFAEKHKQNPKLSVAFSNLVREPLLIGNEADWSAFRDILFKLYAQEGTSPTIVAEASSAAALFGLAAKGMGITFYAGMPKLYQGSSLAFRTVTPRTTIPVSLVWRKGVKLPLVQQVLKDARLGKS